MLTGDFNRDGNADIVASHGDAGVTMLLGHGNGNFTCYEVPLALGPGLRIIGLVATADFNGDGHPDIVAITQDTNSKYGSVVLLGNGDGSFRAPIMLGSDVVKAVADFNGDGKLDLLVHCWMDIDCGFAARFGNGDGTFEPAGPFTPQAYGDFSWAAVGDFNGDGKPDVLETSFRSSNKSGAVYLWLGKGDGTFASPIVSALPPPPPNGSSFTPSHLVAGDFNHDGHLDVAALVHSDYDGVEVLLGDGTGSFTSVAPPYVLPAPGPLIAADFRHAGILDLAAGFTVLPGNGDGSYGEAQPFGQYHPPTSGLYYLASYILPGGISWVATADFNGDGMPDLVGPAGNGTQLSILLSNTAGSDASAYAVSAAD